MMGLLNSQSYGGNQNVNIIKTVKLDSDVMAIIFQFSMRHGDIKWGDLL